MATVAFPLVLRPTEVEELLDDQPGARLLDVRMPGEYETVHIEGAYNVPLDALGEHAREIASVTDPIVLVCQSGQRARKAEDMLKALGMVNLHMLDGGVNGWVAAGLPVVRGVARLSLERQVRIGAGALAATGGLLAALVHPAFGFLAAFVGSGLVFAGITNFCGMAMLLAKLPYNRQASCDVAAMVRALSDGTPRAAVGRDSMSANTPGRCCT